MATKGKWVEVVQTCMNDLVSVVKVAQDSGRELRVRFDGKRKAGFPPRIVIEMLVPKNGGPF